MLQVLKQIFARLAVTFLTAAVRAHESEPTDLAGEAIVKLCREAWSWLAGACGTVGGLVAEHDLTFWLGALVLLLTAADRCYEILIKCRRFRGMSAGNGDP